MSGASAPLLFNWEEVVIGLLFASQIGYFLKPSLFVGTEINTALTCSLFVPVHLILGRGH